MILMHGNFMLFWKWILKIKIIKLQKLILRIIVQGAQNWLIFEVEKYKNGGNETYQIVWVTCHKKWLITWTIT